MALQEPDNAHPDQPREDGSIHIRDTERAPASTWQIVMVSALVIAILCVFFYGLTSQRIEVAGSTPPPASQTNVPATEQQKQTVGTTGQAPNPGNPPGATRQQQPQKANPTTTPQNGGQNAVQPPAAPRTDQ
jgi:hypothetical protein